MLIYRHVEPLRDPFQEKSTTTGRAAKARSAREQGSLSSIPCQAVHFRRETEVELGEAPGVVRREIHGDAVPRVRPVRMVVQLLGLERDARHEGEGLGEIAEGERAVKLLALVRPAWKSGEPLVSLG